MIVHLNDSNFETETAGKKVVMIDFFATWCGPCKMFAPTFEKVSEASDAMFVKVDVEQAPELARRFRIMSVPTIIKLVDGEIAAKTMGAISEAALIQMVNG